MSSIFKQIAGSKASKGGAIIKPGSYTFEVQNVMVDPKCFGGAMFIAEFKVLEAKPTVDGIVPNMVGSSCSFVVNLVKNQGIGLGNAKAFLIALAGSNEEEMTDELISELVEEVGGKKSTQPMRFTRIKDEVFTKKQRTDASKDFTVHKWQTVELTEADWAEINARRAAEKPATPAAK